MDDAQHPDTPPLPAPAAKAPPAEARSVDASRGMTWWTDAWALFMRNPGMWVVMGIALLILYAILGLVPVLGGLAVALVSQIFVGGWLLAARKLEGGGTIEVGDLFLGFKGPLLNPLIALGAMVLGGSIAIALVALLLGGGAALAVWAGGEARALAGAGMAMLMVLACMGLAFVLAMAFWFAAALVVFRSQDPVEAAKSSIAASLRNVIPFLLYGVVWIVLAVVATIPLMLGWIVLIPVTMLSIYTSYKDLYEG